MFGWYKYCFSHYFTLSGRASRAEFWSFFFVNLFIQILITVVGVVLGVALSTPASEAEEAANFAPALTVWVQFLALGCIYFAATILPSIAVTVRRMHDRDLSGWWVTAGIFLSPFLVGELIGIFIFICMLLGSLPMPNRYGVRAPRNPKDEVPYEYTMHMNQMSAYNVQRNPEGLAQINPSGNAIPTTPQPPQSVPPAPIENGPSSRAESTSNQSLRSDGTRSLLDEMRERSAANTSKPLPQHDSSEHRSSDGSSTHRPMTPQESSLVSALKKKSRGDSSS